MIEYAENIFTPRARQVMHLAEKEAERLHNDFVGTEHLLLGIVRYGEESSAAQILTLLGVTLQQIELELEKKMKLGPDEPEKKKKVALTPRTRKVLSLADKERKDTGRPYIGTEHLLLGLLREGQGTAAVLLIDHFNLTNNIVREKWAQVFGETPQDNIMEVYERALADARLRLDTVMQFGEMSHLVTAKLGDLRGITVRVTEKTEVIITPQVVASLLASHKHAKSPAQAEDLLFKTLAELRKDVGKKVKRCL